MLFRFLIVLLLAHIIVFVTEFKRYKEMDVTINCYIHHHVRDRFFLICAVDIVLGIFNLFWIVCEWIVTGNISEFIAFYKSLL